MRHFHERVKTGSFHDAAYAIPKGLKSSPRESFNDVVKKHFARGGGLAAAFGGWGVMDVDDAEALRQESIDAFGVIGKRPRNK